MANVDIVVRTIKEGRGLEDANKGLKELLTVAASVTAALWTMKKAFDFAKEGAMLEFTAIKFDRLTDSIGRTGEAMLVDLRAATRGVVSDAGLMKTATDLMALGLANTSEEVIRLSSVAAALGMDIGEMVLALTNQTTRRFDQLGVSVVGFDEKLQTLKATGLSVQDAFTEAFLQQAEEQIERVGHIADTTAGQFLTLEAQATNAAVAIKTEWARFTAPFVAETGNVLKQMNDMRDAANALGAEFTIFSTITGGLVQEFKLANGEIITGEEVLRRYALIVKTADERQEDLNHRAEMWAAIAGQASEVTAELAGRFEDVAGAMAYFNDINSNLNSTIESTIENIRLEALGIGALESNYEQLVLQYGNGVLTLHELEAATLQFQQASILADAAAGRIGDEETRDQLALLGLSLEDINRLLMMISGTHDITLVLDLISRFGGEAASAILNAGTAPSDLTGGKVRQAAGGPVYSGKPYWVGEVGPEPFFPAQNGRILSRSDAMAAMAGGGKGGVEINVYTPGGIAVYAAPGQSLAEQLMELGNVG